MKIRVKAARQKKRHGPYQLMAFWGVKTKMRKYPSPAAIAEARPRFLQLHIMVTEKLAFFENPLGSRYFMRTFAQPSLDETAQIYASIKRYRPECQAQK